MKSLSSALVDKIISQMPGKHILSDMKAFEKKLNDTDSHALLEKMQQLNINIEFDEKEGLGHIYPIWPIKEARDAIKKIENIICS